MEIKENKKNAHTTIITNKQEHSQQELPKKTLKNQKKKNIKY